MFRAALVAATCSMLAFADRADAQYQTRTWLDWRTVETEHFSVHYPSPLERWARSVASKMEGVDSAVGKIVGYRPPRRTQIVIDDPYSISNGSAWAFLDRPALVLWATPPSPREDIGTYVSWADMLSSHEFAHLAHLTRPSRNVAEAALWKLLPVELGPIGRKVPRWVTEGYATYVEGIVTGSGRPNGAWRSSILRQWAIEGKLPPYDRISSYGGMYGGDFAYLAGSAFIEWLTLRRGDSSLVDLWRRLTAVTNRGFDDAFTGVYGEPPPVLYGRFTAELTVRATEAQRVLAASQPDSGHVVQHLLGETGDPAISSDGGRVALLMHSTSRPPRIVIWSTVPAPDTAADRERQQLAKRDPEDVPAIRVFPPPPKTLATLLAVGNLPYEGPRFFRDGRVLVWRRAAVGDGSYVPDLFIWDPQRGTVKRVTRAANVREGDPAPDGSTIAGLRCSSGHCDVVLVDARSGAVRLLAEGSETRSFYRPRFAPDGRSILVSMHDAGRWALATVSGADGAVSVLTLGGNFYDASFTDDSTIVTTAELDRIPTVVRLRPGSADAAPHPLAHVTGAAVGAEYNPADQSVWFLSLHAQGWDLRSAPLNSSVPQAIAFEPFRVLMPTSLPTPRQLPAGPVGATHRYGLGPRKWVWIPGTAWSDEGASLTLSLVNSDIVGRHEVLFQWQGGTDQSWQGTSLALTSRASRLPWALSGFMVRQDFLAPIPTVLHGGVFTIEAAHRVETSSQRLSIGGIVSDLKTSAAPDGLRALGFATTAFGFTSYGDGTRTSLQVSLHGTAGQSGGTSVTRGMATVSFDMIPFALSGAAGAVRSTSPFEQFTIGGLQPVILHPSVLSQRIAMPVLPTTYAMGKQLLMYRLATSGPGPTVYLWAAKVGRDSTSRWERVRGFEWVGVIPEIATIGTPTARFTVGFGTWLNGPHVDLPLIVGGQQYDLRQRSLTQFYITTQFGDWSR